MDDTEKNTSVAIRTEIAEKFVDLALTRNKQEWLELKTCSKEETQVFFDVVSAAGLSLEKVELGKLVESYRDNDGLTGETYTINKLCPFKVVCEGGGDYLYATGWLDCVLGRVVHGASQLIESREELIDMVDEEIKRSIPLEPIELTHEGDYLCEIPPSALVLGYAYFVQHTRDEDDLGRDVGIHKFCGGVMTRRGATKTHDTIVCRSCYRPDILFTKKVKTYGDLRKEQMLYLLYQLYQH